MFLWLCFIYLINKGVISPYVQEQGEMLLKFNILHLHYVTHYSAIELNASLFKAALWSIKRSTLCAIWENNLETFEKLFSITQSSCSIYSLFLKPLHWNIHELWEQALIVMKITSDFEKIVKASCFLHLTSVNWSVLKIRLCFDKWCRVLSA